MTADTCPACGTVATTHAGFHLTETCRCSDEERRAAGWKSRTITLATKVAAKEAA